MTEQGLTSAFHKRCQSWALNSCSGAVGHEYKMYYLREDLSQRRQKTAIRAGGLPSGRYEAT